ncbi:MAG: HEAT repeat domain-containing protein, partial [Planctomycetota bacterium]
APRTSLTARQPTQPERVAPKPIELGEGEIEQRVAALLKEYDEIVLQTGRARSIQERRQMIDSIRARLIALGPAAVPALMAAIQQDLGTGRTDRPSTIIEALAEIPGPEALGALSEILASGGSPWGIKLSAVAQLARRDEEGMKLLREQVQRESDYRIRGAILKQLGKSGDPESMRLIAQLAKNDPDIHVRRAAVRALSGTGDDGTPASQEAMRVLEDIARFDSDVSVRQSAIQAYAAAAGEQAVLNDLIQTDTNTRVKSVAILGLQRVNSDEAVRILQTTADDPNQTEEIRQRARGALAGLERMRSGGQSGPTPVRDRLKPLDRDGGSLGPLRPIGGG